MTTDQLLEGRDVSGPGLLDELAVGQLVTLRRAATFAL